MSFIPHPDQELLAVNCGVITVSDTRKRESDRSGQLIEQLLEKEGHRITFYTLIPDSYKQIQQELKQLSTRTDIDTIILNGGTGIAPRDNTYDAIVLMLEKTLPGFGELFRFLSYQEIGSRAMASRAIAGVYQQKLIFSLPGSTNAVKLAMEKLIIPELVHLMKQLKQ